MNTTFEVTQPPLPYKLAGSIAAALEKVGVHALKLDVNKLKAQAEKSTGLTDWGDPQFLQDVETFIAYANRNPQGTALSRIPLRGDLIRRMTNVLKLEAAKKSHADLLSQPIKSPFIVVGLPRTGTTLLQRLLSQDQAAHGPALWELFNPVQVDSKDTDEQRRKAAASFEKTVRSASEVLWGIHPMLTDEADECFFLLPQGLGDLVLHQPMEYFDYFMRRSALFDYQMHKQLFQTLHYGKTARRWVWKSPLHLPKLDEMLTVYPDAQVIWCHRDLSFVLASWFSYTALSRKFVLPNVDPKKVAADWVKIWRAALEEAQKARDKRSSGMFFDMSYTDLVNDPIGMIRRIYRHFGMELSIPAEAKMKAWLDRDKQMLKVGHRYTLDQFGLTVDELETTFSSYLEKYKLSVI